MPSRPRIEKVEVGKAYRLKPPFGGRGPGDAVVVVSAIKNYSKTQRTVWFGTAERPEGGLANYSEFIRRVWAEEPTAIN